MKRFLLFVLLAGAAGGGYWWHTTHAGAPPVEPDPVPGTATLDVLTNLGFLGGAAHGAVEGIRIPDPRDPESTCDPGGVVLRDVDPGGPLGKLGLQPGDVIVSVGRDPLPNKEDPSLDLLRRIEGKRSAGIKEMPLGYLRGGELASVSLVVDLPALEEGFPQRSRRFELAAEKAIAFLKKAQNKEDGWFGAPGKSVDARLAVSSVVGLALVASGIVKNSKQLGPCVLYVQRTLDTEKKISHWAAAYAALFLSEVSSDETVKLSLAKAVGHIWKAQAEDGGWAVGGAPGYNERTLATNLCLTAIGTAERAGVKTADNKRVEKACAYLKKQSNDGDVGFSTDPTFDRRSEAGRTAGALVALRTLSCRQTGELVQKLLKYYSEHADEIEGGPVAVPTHMLASALVARRLGLPGWLKFLSDSQVGILALQKLDGSFVGCPESEEKAVPFLRDCDGPAWRTAHYAVILQLPGDPLPLLAMTEPVKWKLERDDTGKIVSAAEAKPKKPKGGAMSIEQAIEMMKKMGLTEDSPQIKKLRDLQKKMGGGKK